MLHGDGGSAAGDEGEDVDEDQPTDKWAGTHQLLLPAALHLLATHEASPPQVKQIVAAAAAAVAANVKLPDDADTTKTAAEAEAAAEVAAAAAVAKEEVPYIPGDEDAPAGLYRAVLIKPPQVGGDNSGASFMDLIRDAALAAKAGMLDNVDQGIGGGNKGGGGGGGSGGSGGEDEKARKRNPAWIAKQINKAVRGEGRWPWSDDELKGGIIWEGALRSMCRDAPPEVINKEAEHMAKGGKVDFGIDL